MSTGSGFGPNPWQQTNWDWRAAGNFMAGGAGAGLLITGALLAPPDARQVWAAVWLMLPALALVGLGLLCVWLEIGRPLRALHVFLNPRTSWMSREAYVAALLFPAGLLAMLGLPGWLWGSVLLALAFLYCQSCMLPAARGIPAWRGKHFTLLMFVTGLCEGCGLLLLLGLFQGQATNVVTAVFALLVVARIGVWRQYRGGVQASLAPRAKLAMDGAGRILLWGGSAAPLALLVISVLLGSGGAQAALLALAGACAAAAGATLKFKLVTRASFNQGFALTQIPVRGVRASQ